MEGPVQNLFKSMGVFLLLSETITTITKLFSLSQIVPEKNMIHITKEESIHSKLYWYLEVIKS